ncbi:uncharacterized protein METZ01_LOCUS374202, partial [marine metagenome]
VLILPSARENTIASRVQGMDRAIGPILLLSACLLVIGWFSPMMTVNRFLFLEKQISVFDSLLTFALHGEILLLVIVFLFSVVFPAAKIISSYLLWYEYDVTSDHFEKRVRILQGIGKWSMVDVFVVALVVAAVKVSIIGDIYLHWGLYSFAASVLLAMIALSRLTTLAHRMTTTP